VAERQEKRGKEQATSVRSHGKEATAVPVRLASPTEKASAAGAATPSLTAIHRILLRNPPIKAQRESTFAAVPLPLLEVLVPRRDTE